VIPDAVSAECSFNWSTFCVASFASPGLETRSTLTGVPREKFACDVCQQPLVGAAVNAKSFTVVPPSVTTTGVLVLELEPAFASRDARICSRWNIAK